MATVGFIVPPVPGHVLPSIAQAQALQARGHRVRFYHLGDLRTQIEAAGIEFCTLGETRLPAGTLPRMRKEVAALRGLRASFRSVQQFLCTGEMFAAELPDALSRDPVDLMMVDQVEPVGGLVARALKLPYVTVSNALPIMPDPGIQPPTTDWLPGGPLCELRNSDPNIHFVEDRLDTLLGVAECWELQAVRLYLVDWGYNTSAQRREAGQHPRIRVLTHSFAAFSLSDSPNSL